MSGSTRFFTGEPLLLFLEIALVILGLTGCDVGLHERDAQLTGLPVGVEIADEDEDEDEDEEGHQEHSVADVEGSV